MQIDITKLPELLALLGASAPSPASPLIGKHVIVRSRDSGVHAGTLTAVNGRHVSLTNARRLWYWVAAKEHTLSAVALHGLKSGSKLASPVAQVDVLDACEITPTTTTAQASIDGMKSHEPS
jgi:hypothetical protein